MPKIRCTFRPQAWVRDHAIDVDPNGPTTWEMDAPDPLPESNSDDSDLLREDPAAPEWVRDWPGPFEVDYVVL